MALFCSTSLDPGALVLHVAGMTNAANITTNENLTVPTLTVELDGLTMTYSSDTDPRIEMVSDGKLHTATEEDAAELVREMRAWGMPARALGYAVYPLGSGFGA